MSPASPALIARLRRRLTTAVWLLALLVLAKSALATSCLGDGVASSGTVASISAAAHDQGAAPLLDDNDDAPCWHGGAGGCHCACAHGLGLPVADAVMHAMGSPSSPPQSSHAAFLSSARQTALRPPIA